MHIFIVSSSCMCCPMSPCLKCLFHSFIHLFFQKIPPVTRYYKLYKPMITSYNNVSMENLITDAFLWNQNCSKTSCFQVHMSSSGQRSPSSIWCICSYYCRLWVLPGMVELYVCLLPLNIQAMWDRLVHAKYLLKSVDKFIRKFNYCKEILRKKKKSNSLNVNSPKRTSYSIG